MDREIENISKKAYTPPGTFVHVGDENIEEAKIVFTKYNRKDIQIKETKDLKEILEVDLENTKWLDIIGLHDVAFIDSLGKNLGIHPLVIEDILNTSQSSKVENYGDYVFIVIKNIFLNEDYNRLEDDEDDAFEFEYISFLLFESMVISFQETRNESFTQVLSRLEKGSNLRSEGADSLLHALIDYTVDNYLVVMEDIGNTLDILEDELLEDPDESLLESIYNIKKSLIYIRNELWPMRNTINHLSKKEYDLIEEKTIYYFRDIYDHIIQTIGIIETYREICSDMLSTYLSSIGNQTNDVMRVLTVFSTVFIPLSFLAGVYGMNFRNFPELDWKYGYASFWIISLGVIIFMFRYFKKKDWI